MGKFVIHWSMQKLVWMIVQILQNKFDCFIVIDGNRGLGKTLVKGSKVLLQDGSWKKVEDIKIGDKVISPQKDGSFSYASVIGLHSRFEKETYEVREATRNKKLLYSCAGNHEIPYLRISHPRKIGGRSSKQVLDTAQAKDLAKKQWASDNSHICCFSSTAIDYENKNCSLDGYTLGVWLGDGHFTKDLGITSDNPSIMNLIPYPLMNTMNKQNTSAKTYRYSILGKFAKHLEDLGLRYKKSGTKFIPKKAMLSSIKYRFELLAGLIDTDGYVAKDNHISITTKSLQLAKDISDLVFSLGGHSSIRKVKKKCQNNFEGEYHEVKISFENPQIIPLKNEFKKQRLGIKMKHNPRHIGIRVLKGKPNFVYGFELDPSETKSQWHITDNWMVTHNSTLAIHLTRRVAKEFKKIGSEDYKFHWKNSMIYTKKETKRFWNSWKKLGIGDELINTTFNRDFYNEEQKDIIKLINLNRDHNNLFIACVPAFQVIDNQIKNLCKIRITIVRRGLAVIHTPCKSIYIKDKWDQATNERIEREWVIKNAKNPAYSRLTTFRGLLKFPPLHPVAEEKYQSVKNEKRTLIAKEEMGIEMDGEEKKDFYDVFIQMLQENKVRNSTFLDGFAQANGKDPETFRNGLRSRLKRKGLKHVLSDYYWDRKEKKEEEKSIVTG